MYLLEEHEGPRTRLLGFGRVELDPGESRTVALDVDARQFAKDDAGRGQWPTPDGRYRLTLGHSAGDCAVEAEEHLTELWFAR